MLASLLCPFFSSTNTYSGKQRLTGGQAMLLEYGDAMSCRSVVVDPDPVDVQANQLEQIGIAQFRQLYLRSALE